MPGLSRSNPGYLDELGTNWQETPARRRLFAPRSKLEDRLAAQGAASRGSFDCRKAAADNLSSGLSYARRLFRQQGRDSHEVVGEHSRSNPQLEAVMSLGETSLHAATSEQHRDAPLDAGAKALALLEVRALLVGFALRISLAAALRNAHDLDAITLARCQVLFAEEAAIRAVQFRDPTKGLPMVPKGRSHMDFVGRVSLQHLVLRDQALCAFGEKDLVAELDGRAHLASLDQVGVRFKNGINLLAVGYLFAIEHAATRLIDHTASQLTKVLDLFAEFFDGRVGKHIPAAQILPVFSSAARAFPTTSSAIPMSTRYVAVCCSWRCRVVIRWIACIRRRAERLRSLNPLIRRSSSALARRPTRRVTTRTTSHNNVLSVGW